MINPINTGAILPFYTETASRMSHSRQVSQHADGFRILASNKSLIPFIFWELTAPQVVVNFQLFNIGSGAMYDLSTSLIDRRKRVDNSKTWYIFDGSDIGQTIPCGTYKLRVEFALSSYISDEIEIVNALGPEYATLTATACATDILTLESSETTESSVIDNRLHYRLSNSNNWIQVLALIGTPTEFNFSLSPNLSANESIQIRHTVTTEAGNTLVNIYSLTYDNGDKCGTYQIHLIDDRSTYAGGDLWEIQLSDSIIWGDKIYEAGFVEKIYLRGHWDFPEAEREVEILTDNQANAVLNTADTREYLIMIFEKVADHLIYKLAALGDYSTISLYSVFTDYSITGIPGAEAQFSTDTGSGYYSTGKLRFRDQKHFETACTEGETTVIV